MLRNLRTIRPLITGKLRGWVTLAIVGSVVLAGLDILGVAAMLPLMQLLTSGDTTTGVSGWIAGALGTQDLQTLILAMACLIAAAFLLKSVFAVLFRWWLLGRTTKLTAYASTELLRRYVLAPYSIHKTRKLAEVYRNIGASVPQTFNQVALGLLTLFSDLLTLLALAAVLFIASPIATLFALVVLAGSAALMQKMMKAQLIQAGEAMAEAELQSWSAVMPGMEGFREARLTASGEMFLGQYFDARLQISQAQRKISLFGELPRYVLEFMFVVAIAGMTIVLFATGSPEAAVVTLGVFAAASLRMLPTLNRVTATLASIRSGSVGLELLAGAVTELGKQPVYVERRSSTQRFSGDIELKSVVFRYADSDTAVLNGLNLTIPEGKTTALVGSSGAGKSTLLDLILGLVPPQSGRVEVGGRIIDEDVAAWYLSLGVVPQDVYLTHASFRENVAYGVPSNEIDEERLQEAISSAQLYDFVSELPEGLETQLGERGVRLSGGQRQRLGIARALYRNPAYLILDEATSALDNETEYQITRTIEALKGKMTVIIVAHRLSTVRHADQIIFLTAGSIESQGTFEEVRANNEEFAHLVRLGQL